MILLHFFTAVKIPAIPGTARPVGVGTGKMNAFCREQIEISETGEQQPGQMNKEQSA
jgi:hypothetical protein